MEAFNLGNRSDHLGADGRCDHCKLVNGFVGCSVSFKGLVGKKGAQLVSGKGCPSSTCTAFGEDGDG